MDSIDIVNEISNEIVEHDMRVAPGLVYLLEWAEAEQSQADLEAMLQTVRSLRLGRAPDASDMLEQQQAAYARTGDKILRAAVREKNAWHDKHYYQYGARRGKRKLPPGCDHRAMGLY